jgi:non-ribosomal peptide synthetase component F
VRPDQRVAICVERGPQMLVGLLGILKAGAGYVPIDPAYPLERIAYTLQDSAPVAVLTQADTLDGLALKCRASIWTVCSCRLNSAAIRRFPG